MYNTDLFQASKTRTKQLHDKTAIIYGTHQITYHRLLDAIERLAHSLHRLGVYNSDHFAIMLPNLPQLMISYYALLKLGATVVLINPESDAATLKSILEASNPKGIISLDRYTARIREAISNPTHCKLIICLGDSIPSGCLNLTELIASSKNDLHSFQRDQAKSGLVCYTAGTTGAPKGVNFKHENLMAQVYSIRHALNLNSDHTMLCLLPTSFAFANIVNLMAALTSGSTVLQFTKFNAKHVADSQIPSSDIILFGTPNVYRGLTQLNSQDLSKLKIERAVCTGGFLESSIRRSFAEKLAQPILNSYGLTEAGPLITIQDHHSKEASTSMGLPCFGVELKIVDGEKKEIHSNGLGEIVICGTNVMNRYLKPQEENNSTFLNGWLYTGDIGRLDLDGQLHFLGRKSDMIFKGGFGVFPQEVESVLRTHPKVRTCRVVGVKDGTLGEEIKALVVPVTAGSISIKELSRYCSNRLALFKCPKYFEIVHSLP